MNFKKWYLEHIESEHDIRSWLDPVGRFHPLGKANHGDAAHQLTKNRESNPMNQLFLNGWMRIYYYGRDLYAHNPSRPLTTQQTTSLIDLATKTQRFDRILYDNEDRDRVIWHVDFD